MISLSLFPVLFLYLKKIFKKSKVINIFSLEGFNIFYFKRNLKRAKRYLLYKVRCRKLVPVGARVPVNNCDANTRLRSSDMF